jgi:cyclomaltodextrinase
MPDWPRDAFFYHLYPLGFCGAPERNDFSSPPSPRLEKLLGWLDHLSQLGVNALYLGPLFESSSHGYDTADYRQVDRRLGDNRTLTSLSAELHRRGLRLVLDGVLHHVGRDFWAFRDLQTRGQGSAYRDWFSGVDFRARSPLGDAFTYDNWEGHAELVKLNLRNPQVRAHLLEAAEAWIREFDLDGLRLDVAYLLDEEFLRELGGRCRALKADFWLLGEVIHGDYRRWLDPGLLDSVTNYECYKGLYSSHNDRNYFEIAHSLNRQFGEHGLYRDRPLYNFADNHDVDRVATSLREPAHLYPLYCLLFTIPGVPSLYYGSEWGMAGSKTSGSDRALRPSLELEQAARESPHPQLAASIARLAGVRAQSRALRRGSYRPLFVGAEQFAFERRCDGETVLVAVNAAGEPAALVLPLPAGGAGPGAAPAHAQGAAPPAAASASAPGSAPAAFTDLLNGGENFRADGGRLRLEVPPRWARVLRQA